MNFRLNWFIPFAGRLRASFLVAGLLLFPLCLVLPAYHAYEDTPGLMAFLLGPMGLFDRHFSWLANPVLGAAWIMYWRKKYAPAVTAAIFALLLAGTFLFADTIAVGSSGNSSYKPLSGYYVWLGSIAYTAVAAALGVVFGEKSESEGAGIDSAGLRAQRYAIGGVLFALPAVFAVGPLVSKSNRTDEAFARLCATAGEKITGIPGDVEALYFEQVGGLSFGDIKDGKYRWMSWGRTGETLVNNEFLRFSEYPSEKAKSYRRYDAVAKAQPVDRLRSAYGVFVSKLKPAAEEQLGIVGFETTVKRLANGEQVASKRFFYHIRTSRICGYHDGDRVSDSDFLIRVLHLKRNLIFRKGRSSQP
ncbi:hypothetical protein [Massilia aerilata]|uniref:Uncharacterized protein n=1 Tax=Massilia aerilata TaxID=453817 RepID=A0ABW0S4F8_9BURK